MHSSHSSSYLVTANAIAFGDCAATLAQMAEQPHELSAWLEKCAAAFKKIEETYALHARYLAFIFCDLIDFQIRQSQCMQVRHHHSSHGSSDQSLIHLMIWLHSLVSNTELSK